MSGWYGRKSGFLQYTVTKQNQEFKPKSIGAIAVTSTSTELTENFIVSPWFSVTPE